MQYVYTLYIQSVDFGRYALTVQAGSRTQQTRSPLAERELRQGRPLQDWENLRTQSDTRNSLTECTACPLDKDEVDCERAHAAVHFRVPSLGANPQYPARGAEDSVTARTVTHRFLATMFGIPRELNHPDWSD